MQLYPTGFGEGALGLESGDAVCQFDVLALTLLAFRDGASNLSFQVLNPAGDFGGERLNALQGCCGCPATLLQASQAGCHLRSGLSSSIPLDLHLSHGFMRSDNLEFDGLTPGFVT